MEYRKKITYSIVASLVLLILFAQIQLGKQSAQAAKANPLPTGLAADENPQLGQSRPPSNYFLYLPLTISKSPSLLTLEQPLPYLQLAPMTHLEVIPAGGEITAYGSNFCSRVGCSTVTLLIRRIRTPSQAPLCSPELSPIERHTPLEMPASIKSVSAQRTMMVVLSQIRPMS